MPPTFLSSKQPYLGEELSKTVIFTWPLCLLVVFTIILPERLTELQLVLCLLAALLLLPHGHLFSTPPAPYVQIQA